MTAINFGKLSVLFSSAAKQTAGRKLCEATLSFITNNREDIATRLEKEPRGYIVCHGDHTSASDLRPHVTVDAFGQDVNGNDEPIGCLHIYTDTTGGYTAFKKARSKAMEVYKRVAESSGS